MNLQSVREIRVVHHEEEVNELLKNGWVIVSTPFITLRRVNDGRDGNYQPVDIPYRQFVLGKLR